MSETTESPDTRGPRRTTEPTDAEPTAQRDDRSAVMLLGSGELSRELALAFQRLGADVIAVDRYADAPAHGVADRAAVVKMNDAEALTALIERENPRYVVAEAGVIAADALIAVAERGNIEVFPTPAQHPADPWTGRACAGWPPTNSGCPPRRSGSPGRSRS